MSIDKFSRAEILRLAPLRKNWGNENPKNRLKWADPKMAAENEPKNELKDGVKRMLPKWTNKIVPKWTEKIDPIFIKFLTSKWIRMDPNMVSKMDPKRLKLWTKIDSNGAKWT